MIAGFRSVVGSFGLALVLMAPGVATPAAAATRELRPLIIGWEQLFSVTWGASQRHGRLEVEGFVDNNAPYRVARLRILVDSLDDSGRIVDQRVSWVFSQLTADDRLPFRVSVAPAARYRVRVFSYDRIDDAGVMIP
ncbi:MAG TPA: FxLYD domain-containing protein [Methylomirabilota bacterium]